MTTNYTKDEPPRHKPLPKLSQEPIYGPPDFGKPANSIDANDEHPPDNILDVDIPFSDLPQIHVWQKDKVFWVALNSIANFTRDFEG